MWNQQQLQQQQQHHNEQGKPKYMPPEFYCAPTAGDKQCEGWPIMKKSKQTFHGYELHFLRDARYINTTKQRLLVCKNGSLAIFDLDGDTATTINMRCQQLLDYFPSKLAKLPICNNQQTLFLKADGCLVYTVHYHGCEHKQLPAPGKVFFGKLCLKLSGVKTKDGMASPMLKVDQILLMDEDGDKKPTQIEYRIPFDDEEEEC